MDNIVGNATKIDSTMYNKMISAYKNRVGGTDADAKNWLTSKNYIPTFFTGTSSNPKKF